MISKADATINKIAGVLIGMMAKTPSRESAGDALRQIGKLVKEHLESPMDIDGPTGYVTGHVPEITK